ncbi:outer membrane beta-barrel protein [Algoriphagus sp. CAU 1675]|uniref:outer membrane beta-barrel protein n=1 Tax=Algoriphagus sp. CAU 1675 TaxID=3032597 RepID=UPI0023DBE092|nr:outer membrane beta-barrel protein [Algoriphagus sp. CAU 1675]MDF2157333.1 hypothetical protein [Algoriphagus sp. CAU 1675]
MKKISPSFVLITFFLLISIPTLAQRAPGLGIKFGMNYASSGKYFQDAETVWQDPLQGVGYLAGVFYKLGFYGLYLRPELNYTQSGFDDKDLDFRAKRLDLPVLAGIQIFKVINAVAGPSFHYSLKDPSNMEWANSQDSKLRMGYQAGLGISVGPIGIDLRYEREFHDRKFGYERIFGKDQPFRSQQVLLALSLRVFDL